MSLILNKVDRLAHTIKRDLNDGAGPFGLGQKGLDAKEVRSITKALSNMSPKNADKLFDKLEKMGLLCKFVREVMESPDLRKGGMTASDRGALFSTLARSLDGASMASLSNAFMNKASSLGQMADYAGEITRAISTHASLQQQIDFVGASGLVVAPATSRPISIANAPTSGSSSGATGSTITVTAPYTYTAANLYDAGGPQPSDIAQGGIGDCGYLSTLAAVAQENPSAIRNAISYNERTQTFNVQLYTRSGRQVTVRVDQAAVRANIARADGSGSLLDNNPGQRTPVWPAVMESAFARLRDSNHRNGVAEGYQAIGKGEFPSSVMMTVTGSEGRSAQFSINPGETQAQAINRLGTTVETALNANKPVTAWTVAGTSADGLVDDHVYSVSSISQDSSGNWQVELRNPWGQNNWEGFSNNSATTTRPLQDLVNSGALYSFQIGR